MSFVSRMGLVSLLLMTHAYAQPKPQGPVPVGVVVAEKQAIAPTAEFVGRIDAIERVNLRARVTGYLDAVLFKAGEHVKEGDPLFRVDQAPFQATVQQEQGALLRAQARLTNATLQADRAEELVKTNATSVAERDRRVADKQAAQGDVVTADGNLRTAKINLGYTVITAPIDGIISKTDVTKGNLVGPDSGVLTTIVSEDPMYVTFPVSQREFLTLRRSDIQGGQRKVSVTVRFSDGSVYDKPGVVNFLDVKVDRSTDTILVRATLPNPDGALIDGQLVRVAVQGDKPQEKVLVPQAALLADQQGTYLFTVQDGKATVRLVKVGGNKGTSAVIDEGLSGGEQVIVQGIEALRPGSPVTPTPMPPDANRS
jgi:membrane fusion protein (multidrug efflux system)